MRARRTIYSIVISVSLKEKEIIVIAGNYENQEKDQEKSRKKYRVFTGKSMAVWNTIFNKREINLGTYESGSSEKLVRRESL